MHNLYIKDSTFSLVLELLFSEKHQKVLKLFLLKQHDVIIHFLKVKEIKMRQILKPHGEN